MRSYTLKIADYLIKIESDPDGPDLTPSLRFKNFICSEPVPDIIIRVHNEPFNPPEDTERVFHAPYVEEINGMPVKKDDQFWSVFRNRSDLFISTIFPLSGKGKRGWLKFSLSYREWDLWLANSGDTTDPLEYPLDGLVLYYLTVIYGDIFIHASAINLSGHGYLFSGISGKGKTTMARLWKEAGAEVIHDDRIIIRHNAGSYRMHNTPVYDNEIPSSSTLTRMFFIDHGSDNSFIPVSGAGAVSNVMANCIQHNWNPEIIARLMGSISIMCSIIPCINLRFRPDKSIVDFILEYE